MFQSLLIQGDRLRIFLAAKLNVSQKQDNIKRFSGSLGSLKAILVAYIPIPVGTILQDGKGFVFICRRAFRSCVFSALQKVSGGGKGVTGIYHCQFFVFIELAVQGISIVIFIQLLDGSVDVLQILRTVCQDRICGYHQTV